MNVNKAIVAGRLTRDPELRSTGQGTPVANFTIATTEYRNVNDQREEKTEFHDIVVFGKQAEACAQYLEKGAVALVEGKIQTRSYESNGEKKYRTEIIAQNVQFGQKAQRKDAMMPSSDGKTDRTKPVDYPQDEINPDDIPF